MAKRITMIVPVFAAAASLVHGDVVSPLPAAPTLAAAPATDTLVPSRLLTTAVDQQLAALRSRMRINASDKGPFGFYQDPEKAARSAIEFPSSKPKIAQVATPFEDVVQAVPVSLVNPSAQEFMVNARTIRTGDQFPLVVGRETLPVRIERVRNSGVLFRNLKTGKLAEKKMEFHPEGVIEARGGEVIPDGIIPIGEGTRQKLVIDPANIKSTIKPTITGRSR